LRRAASAVEEGASLRRRSAIVARRRQTMRLYGMPGICRIAETWRRQANAQQTQRAKKVGGVTSRWALAIRVKKSAARWQRGTAGVHEIFQAKMANERCVSRSQMFDML